MIFILCASCVCAVYLLDSWLQKRHSKSVLIGTFAGLSTVILCELFASKNIISAIFIFQGHYTLHQEDGLIWIKKAPEPTNFTPK